MGSALTTIGVAENKEGSCLTSLPTGEFSLDVAYELFGSKYFLIWEREEDSQVFDVQKCLKLPEDAYVLINGEVPAKNMWRKDELGSRIIYSGELEVHMETSVEETSGHESLIRSEINRKVYNIVPVFVYKTSD